MPDTRDLQVLIESRMPIIAIEFHDEPQVLNVMQRLSKSVGKPLYHWTCVQGLMRLGFGFDMEGEAATEEPGEALKQIADLKQPSLLLLCDFHPYLKDPRIVRQIKEIALRHEHRAHTLVFLSHAFAIPPEWRGLALHFRPRFPRQDELLRIVREEAGIWARENQGQRVRTDTRSLNALVSNLGGLSQNEARRLARTAIVDDGAIDESDLPGINRARFQLMQMDSVLHYEYDTATWGEVGGLSQLKLWLDKRHPSHTAEGSTVQLDLPRGILLVGVQGAGKSLAAKAVAGVWHLPLLRLDMASLYNKFQGETERNMREALQVAETMAPCVLWLDELEKGMAQNLSDDGLSRRLLGSFLTWLAEHKSGVFVVATANQIQDLPPELVRKGRFDELFFVDLPRRAVREKILEIHLRKRGIDAKSFDLKALAEASTGFSGAELEQIIVAGLFQAQSEKVHLTTEQLLAEVSQTRPLSVIMREPLESLRAWAKERCVFAD